MSSSQLVIDGIKGKTTLFQLNCFSWSQSQTIDGMHMLSGIFKSLIKLWTKSGSKGKISSQKWNAFNNILPKQKILSQFKRRVRSLNDYKYWKAHEILIFFLYLTPLMAPYMEKKYYDHLQLLTKSLRSLFSNCISKHDLQVAEQDLATFLASMDDLYGKEYITLNFHQLFHLVDTVRLHGPMWCFTCFPYESFNKILVGFVHGTNHVEHYVAESITIMKELNKRVRDETSSSVLNLISDNFKVCSFHFNYYNFYSKDNTC